MAPNSSVRRLIYHPLCPYSRFTRMIMHEKGLNFSLIKEDFWLERDSFLCLNPSGQLPILVDADSQTVICDVFPVFEYLEETTNITHSLLPEKAIDRAEVRRLLCWFHLKFYKEVSNALLTERVWKRMTTGGYPDSNAIRYAIAVLPEHMHYIASLLKGRDWLAGHQMTAADLAAAAHLSAVDFLGNIPWKATQQKATFDIVREWYARIKSRPSFRALTNDIVEGFTPPLHYADPDF